ncbi:urease accessory protein UreF [Kribbella speibonae]|uniref:Urease accessory protein UreF n=1 Tax=Kribbella speibonae TaxID=1572660 RepID=A0ABY2A8C0_9ACTN|nr:urease accessory UreF family protein [Kribbella speibonae]TCC25327.1 urease accessory protein UreF [Kribbella speibonae]
MGNAELVAMMLADGRLPTGGHTQSGGLEPAVRAGLGADGKQLADVANYARDRLRTTTRVEAAVAVVTRHLTLCGTKVAPGDEKPPDTAEPIGATGTGSPSRAEWLSPTPPSREAWPENPSRSPRLDEPPTQRGWLGVVEGAWAARVPSQVLRGVSRRQGRLLLRLARRVWPGVSAYLPNDGEIARPVVLGVVGAVTGLSAEQVARTVAYDDAQTVISASLKLLPVDPADAATWLAGLHDDIERLVKDVAPLTHIDEIPADGAPLIDVFAHHHAIERMRLFHA